MATGIKERLEGRMPRQAGDGMRQAVRAEPACAAEVWHPAREHSGGVHRDVHPFLGALSLPYTRRLHSGRCLRADGDSLALFQPTARTQAQA